MESTLVVKHIRAKRLPQTQAPVKLDFIDSLRGVAILMVIFMHTAQSISGLSPELYTIAQFGQMGVQLFFVLSAYTLCLSMEKRYNGLKSFYIRRYFRIAPLYYTGILLYFLLASFGIGSYAPSHFLAYISNIFFFHGFYEPGNNTVVPGGWSIGTEMAFYLIFPFLFARLCYIGKWVVLTPFLAIAVSIACFGSVQNSTFYYSNLINQLPVFLVGIAYYRVRDTMPNKWVSLAFCLLMLGASLKAFVSVDFTIIPLICALAYVFLIEVFKHFTVLNTGVLQRIGRLSYSMYIIHFLFAWDLPAYVTDNLRIPSILSFAICCFISTIGSYSLAILTEKWIEKRGIKLGGQLIKRLQ